MRKLLPLALLVAVFQFSRCAVTPYTVTHLPIGAWYLDSRHFTYVEKYGIISSKSDTTFFNKNLKLIYVKGKLHQIGNFCKKNQQPKGFWLDYDENFGVTHLIHYKKHEIDTFNSPYSWINENW